MGNPDKQKSLHALGLQPAARMDATTLQQKPAGTTPCPYSIPRKRPMDDNLGEQVMPQPVTEMHTVVIPSNIQ